MVAHLVATLMVSAVLMVSMECDTGGYAQDPQGRGGHCPVCWGVPLSWDLATVAMYAARLWDYAFLWQPPPPILCTLVSLV